MAKSHLLAFGAGLFVSLLAQFFLKPTALTSSAQEISSPGPLQSTAVAPQAEPTCPTTEPQVIYKCETDEPNTPLAAPLFKSSLPEILETNREGEVHVQWQSVEHANQYQVQMYDPKGRLVKTWKTSRTYLYLRELPYPDDQDFTVYQIRLVALTKAGLPGAESETKELHVRRLKTVVAPNIEAITVED